MPIVIGGGSPASLPSSGLRTLSEARIALTKSVLHIGATETFGRQKQDEAIAAAVNEFNREVAWRQVDTGVTLGSGSRSVTPATSIHGFVPGDFILAEAGGLVLAETTLEDIRRHFIGGTPTGTPTKMAISGDGTLHFNTQPTGDVTVIVRHLQTPARWAYGSRGAWASGAAYMVEDTVTAGGGVYRCVQAHTAASPTNDPPNATYWTPLPMFTEDDAVDPDAYELPLPGKFFEAVIWWAASGHLLYGAPNHPEAVPAMQKWQDILAQAKAEFPRPQPPIRRMA